MTIYCFALNSLITERGSIDDFLHVLYACSEDRIASARCWFVDTIKKLVHVEHLGKENYLVEYDRPLPSAPASMCPTSLIGVIVDWDTKKTIWRRDAKTHQVPAIKHKRKKTNERDGICAPYQPVGKEVLF